jgi:hypothetical protein
MSNDRQNVVVDPSLVDRPTIESATFKVFAADTFGLRLGDNLCQIVFALQSMDANDREILLREATAVLSLQSIKVLHLLLSNAIAALEAQVGPIALAPGKEAQLHALFRTRSEKKAD